MLHYSNLSFLLNKYRNENVFLDLCKPVLCFKISVCNVLS